MIPHIIHYCWFGYNKKPKIIEKCIASWRKFHPDWEIKEWNEENYDVNKIPYIAEAYRQKKWAFVVDFARFDILNEYGGIFLDTDVEFLKSIPEELLELDCFTGFENEERIAPGLIYATIPHHEILGRIMDVYKTKPFSTDETICDIVTGILCENGMKRNNQKQYIANVTVFPSEYFCCFNFETQQFETTEKTISIHHYIGSWTPRRKRLHFKIIKLIAAVLGKERYLRWKRKIKKKK